MEIETFLAILASLGIGGIIGAYFTEIFRRQSEQKSELFAMKQARFKAILILMYAYIKPKELPMLQRVRPELTSLSILKRELQTEFVNSCLFASESTLHAFSAFLTKPSEKSYLEVVFSMREELWLKKPNLSSDERSVAFSK